MLSDVHCTYKVNNPDAFQIYTLDDVGWLNNNINLVPASIFVQTLNGFSSYMYMYVFVSSCLSQAAHKCQQNHRHIHNNGMRRLFTHVSTQVYIKRDIARCHIPSVWYICRALWTKKKVLMITKCARLDNAW